MSVRKKTTLTGKERGRVLGIIKSVHEIEGLDRNIDLLEKVQGRIRRESAVIQFDGGLKWKLDKTSLEKIRHHRWRIMTDRRFRCREYLHEKVFNGSSESKYVGEPVKPSWWKKTVNKIRGILKDD